MTPPGCGTIRGDGRKLHPAYPFEVKRPEDNKAPWDASKLLATMSAEEAFQPLKDGDCPIVRG